MLDLDNCNKNTAENCRQREDCNLSTL